MTKFKKGQQVLIKNPRYLVGTIVEPRPGDKGLPEEQTHYLVQISEERYYLSSELEPAEDPNAKPARYSEEWIAELNRMAASGQQWLQNRSDKTAWDAFVDAGEKIGFIVPIKKAGP